VSWDSADAMEQPSCFQPDTTAAGSGVTKSAAASKCSTAGNKHAQHPEFLPDNDSSSSNNICSSIGSTQPMCVQQAAAVQPSLLERACTPTPQQLQQQSSATQQQQPQQNAAEPAAVAVAADAQQQHQQQQIDYAREIQKSLVRSLRSCSHIDELQELVVQHGDQMDCMSLTSCFSAAGRLATQQQQQKPGLQQDLQQSQSSLVLQVPGNVGQQVPVLQHVHETAQLQQMLQQGQQQQQQQGNAHVKQQLQGLMRQQLLPLLQRKLAQLDAVGLVLVLHSWAVTDFTDEALITDMVRLQLAVPGLLSVLRSTTQQHLLVLLQARATASMLALGPICVRG
jgi:hypothetical protein